MLLTLPKLIYICFTFIKILAYVILFHIINLYYTLMWNMSYYIFCLVLSLLVKMKIKTWQRRYLDLPGWYTRYYPNGIRIICFCNTYRDQQVTIVFRLKRKPLVINNSLLKKKVICYVLPNKCKCNRYIFIKRTQKGHL